MLRFNNILELLEHFPTERDCVAYLEYLRWDGNVVSPFDTESKVYKCKNGKYKCKNMGRYFNVRTGTMYEGTKLPLRKWFIAIWHLTMSKKGISSVQLSKELGVTQKTAWFMMQRIRECFGYENNGELEGTVEIDETFVGGKNKNRHWDKKVKQSQGRSFKDKVPVFGIIQRGGKVIAKVVPDTKAKTLRPIIYNHVKEDSIINTDDWYYGNLNDKYYHVLVDHAKGVYSVGDVTTNSIESFWAIIKRGIIGIYHQTSKKHLQRYVDEFVWRFNNRKLSQSDRFNLLLLNSNYRITYKKLIS